MNTQNAIKKTLKTSKVNKNISNVIIGYSAILLDTYSNNKNLLLVKYDKLFKGFLNSSSITEKQYNKLYDTVLNSLF
ncbi:hypothetical protein [Methanococcus voltae]|uniref:Uncharacterized protein n=1 Tax=Methanococcus voltae (strain ATCC BAA-1334 / A3) TaxID=456320 RepID=D7DRA8_METV3|nr:hypothetical protein [Methanococcus voltae]MCS3901045.1 hypothetical protein [Methanococcus voltae]